MWSWTTPRGDRGHALFPPDAAPSRSNEAERPWRMDVEGRARSVSSAERVGHDTGERVGSGHTVRRAHPEESIAGEE